MATCVCVIVLINIQYIKMIKVQTGNLKHEISGLGFVREK